MKIFKIEWIKQSKKNIIWAIVLALFLGVVLFFALNIQYESFLLAHQSETGLSNWQLVFRESDILFIPMLMCIYAGIVTYELFLNEVQNNAWNITISTKYGTKDVIYGKIMVAYADTLMFIVISDLCTIVDGILLGDIVGAIEWKVIFRIFLIHIFSVFTLICFYTLIVMLTRRIILVIPLTILLFLVHYKTFYSKEFKYYMLNSYATQAIKADNKQALIMCVISVVVSLVFIILSKICFNKNREIRG